jgi:chemotaxis protein MotB
MKKFLFLAVSFMLLTACNQSKIEQLEREISIKDEQITQLEEQIEQLNYTNSSLLDRMSDLSIVSKAGAESIQQSLENINKQYDFIQELTTKMQHKDSLNLALVMNLKRSLADVNDEDIQVEVKGGVVYVSIADRLLFNSGSSKVTEEAEEVLGKVADVINDHDDLQVIVEGHTDNVPISNSCIEDNWDLSVKRATSIVRILQEDHFVDPERLVASGRSEYSPKSENDTDYGKSTNRRTEIIISPSLDQFFKLLEAPALKD